ncbi:MAG: glycosyltransferase family 4 protein [Planctomycetes bacterium]|nr:glycosyltransferase family 4 protein [Planctomycetota bacterium]
MKILFDVSPLGMHGRLATGGIFRVIEEITKESVANAELDSAFTAIASIWMSTGTSGYFRRKAPTLKRRFDPSWHMTFIPPIITDTLRKHIFEWDLAGRPLSVTSWLARCAWFLMRRAARQQVPSGPFDVLHSLCDPLPPRSLVDCRARVITIYDVIPLIHPEFFPETTVPIFRSTLASIDPSRDWVVCNSQSTKRDLMKVIAIDERRIEVIPLAADDRFHDRSTPDAIASVRRRYHLPACRYLLSLSTLEPRKNLAFLIRCFARLAATPAFSDIDLVLAGPKGWLTDELFATFASDGRIQSRVHFPGFIEDDDLAAVYAGALAFVYPSLYEGFGLPPLEAMKCGTPVITSGTSSLPEVVGDAAILIDPRNEDDLCAALNTIATDPVRRLQLSRDAAHRAAGFTWQKTMQRHADFYRRILSTDDVPGPANQGSP